MRIVIDMQGAQTESRFRGIGRYTLSFALAVARNRGPHEVILALSGLLPESIEPIRAAFDGLLAQENIRVWHAPGPVQEAGPGNDARRRVAQRVREAFLASLEPDVIHISSLFEGYVDDAVISIGCFHQSTAVSVSLYDLIPLLNPDQYLKPNPRYAQHYQRKIEDLKKADCLLAISEFTRQEGEGHLVASKGRIVNISTAIDSIFRPVCVDDAATAQLRRKFGLRPLFILYTGGSDSRKNLTRLIRAYAALPAPVLAEHQLLLAGKIPDFQIAEYKQLAKALGLKPDDLCFTGYVTDEELVQLYNLCKLFIFPSWHEGFGLPALEAMACGAPVIGANTSSLPEVIGLDAALFDPLDVDSITAKIAQALADNTFRTTLRDHGLQQAQQFSWDQTAQRAIDAWEALPKPEAEPLAVRVHPDGKPRLALVSPMPPERTGIADYSAALLPALSARYHIELVVEQAGVSGALSDTWAVRDAAWLRANVHRIDRVVYQMGNSPFHNYMLPLIKDIPGTVVLHDFYLSGLMAWLQWNGGQEHAWERALYASHGYRALRELREDPEAAKRRYPSNWTVLQWAQGVIVHSHYARSLARQWFPACDSDAWSVVPQPRLPVSATDPRRVREKLGIAADDFVICSFGYLDPTKHNLELLQAWLDSDLSQDQRCRLIFVGDNHGGDYGVSLLRTLRDSAAPGRICITGFAAADVYHDYLAAADLAVQLRRDSRGETSGAVLDCLSYGIPTIVNANGSMAELDTSAVHVLPDEFTQSELVQTLEALWRDAERRQSMRLRAHALISEHHAPAQCADQYAQAIERACRSAQASVPALIEALSACERPDDEALRDLAQAVAASLPLPRPARTLFLDITATCSHDLKTGIERVARSLLTAWLEVPPEGFRVEPVYLSHAHGEWHHRFARKYTLDLLGCPSAGFDDERALPQNGDIVFVLDITGDTLVQATRAGLFDSYRNTGAAVYSVVYDLLPLQLPEVFPPGAEQSHAAWLSAVATFDGAVCISKAVADDFSRWRGTLEAPRHRRRPYVVGWSHLGADVASSAPTRGLPDSAVHVLAQMERRPSFLMVGTLEPRKGYLQALDAFDRLWEQGVEVNLVIVGREGWKGLPPGMRRDISDAVGRLASHPFRDRRLFWLDDASDEYLEQIYRSSTCLLAASYGEGFGLPLIEAAQHGLPLLARDIPVFREVAGAHACYFQATQPSDFASAVQSWLQGFRAGSHITSGGLPWSTWEQSAAMFATAAWGAKLAFTHTPVLRPTE